MGIAELLGLAASISLLSGWRLYLCTFAVGLAMRFGWIELPHHLSVLSVLANHWVLGISAIGLLAEFCADKVVWIDSIWDSLHTLVRPLGGALLAMAIVDPQDPTWQAASFLLGGGAALLTHGAKAGARTLVNTTPEPFSNAAVSTFEDIVTTGLLWLALAHPVLAGGIALALAAGSIAVLITVRRLLRRLFGRPGPPDAGRA